VKKFLSLLFSIVFVANAQFFDDSAYEEVLVPKSIFITYEEKPKNIYVNEVYPVKVKIVAAVEQILDIKTYFLDGNGTQILNPTNQWQKINDNTLINTYYYKTENENAKIPDIQVNIQVDEFSQESEQIKGFSPHIIKLEGDEHYCGVLAKSFEIKKHKSNRFDNESNIVILEINAHMSNLEDFTLPWVIRDGIDFVSYTHPDCKIYYFAIVPNHLKNFEFKYFDLTSNRFVRKRFPIILENDDVSTQIELNPKESSYNFYKNMIIAIIAVAFFILFLIRKKYLYLILFFGLIVYVLYQFAPLKTLTLKKGTKVSILPTKNSTIFFISKSRCNAQMLNKIDGYVKILLPNNKIGWIKDEDIIKY
jgi:hypothetical protein